MNVKLFQIHLEKNHSQSDQDNLNSFLETVTVKKTATELVSGKTGFWSVLVFYEAPKTEQKTSTSGEKISYPADAELSEKEQKMLAALKQWRFDKSEELGIPAYMVCSNAELTTLVKVNPKTFDELFKVKGFAEQKVAKFGDDIIAVLHSGH